MTALFVWVVLLGCRGLDLTPPALEVRGPVGPVRTMAEFTIKVADGETAVRRLVATVDGERPMVVPLPEGASPLELGWVLGLRSLSHGRHLVAFTAFDDALVANQTVAEVPVEVDRVPAALELHAPTLVAGQGRTASIWVRGKDEPLGEATLVLGDEREPMFPVDGAFRALRGIPIRETPGEVPFTILAEDRAGNASRVEGELRIVATEFEEGGLIKLTPKQTQARRDVDAMTTMRKERDETYKLRTLEQAWEGPFGLPVGNGRLTSRFGRFRTYSDGRRDHHTGMDLAKQEGADIYAAADGRVVLAKSQAVFGNVVILDHGHGVTSSYNHLLSIAVEPGQQVEKGDVIAALGSTGQSTAPHLHWSMVVGDHPVDPDEWLANDFSTSPFERK
ncbi:MAG: peptidoglycan DD-metalloendopeptidase family protein [Myxococcota bacterium]